MESPTRWPPVAELTSVLELVVALVRADRAALLLRDDAANSLRVAAAIGLDAEECALLERPRPAARPLHALTTALGAHAMEIVPLVEDDADGKEDGDGEGRSHAIGEMILLFPRAHATRARMAPLVERCAQLVVCLVRLARAATIGAQLRVSSTHVDDTRAQFFSRMSHELRTPLQSIAGYVDLLRSGAVDPLTPAQARVLARVQHNEETLVRIIEDLVTFARLQTGRVQYRIDVVAADEVVQIAQAVIAPLAAAQRVHVVVDPCRGLLVLADGDKLKQILVNVAAFVVRSCAGPGTIRIGCRAEDTWARFDIADDGPGLSAEQVRGLFEPYVLQSRTLFDGAGTGLGLAISHEFAADMHGQLTVENQAAGGAVFTLRLPRSAASRR